MLCYAVYDIYDGSLENGKVASADAMDENGRLITAGMLKSLVMATVRSEDMSFLSDEKYDAGSKHVKQAGEMEVDIRLR